MSLDAYLTQHTSEDNASFARLQVNAGLDLSHPY